jgi:energy-coupling factor transport system ATP-binding protein
MSGTPREIFSRIDELEELRLDVPQVTRLAHELKLRGMTMLPDGILTEEELVDAICRSYSIM